MSADDSKQPKATIKMLVETAATDDVAAYKSVEDRAPVIIDDTVTAATAKDAGSVAVLNRLVEANMLVPGSRLGREFQDQYRRIKRPLLSNAFGKTASLVEHGNLILVTSSVPGEGKTNTSVNLALSIAQEKDKTVLLVDCDVAKQGTSRILGIEKKTGLVDILEADHMTIGDVLLRTDVPNLRLVSAGKQDDYVAEMLASRRMSDVVQEMVARYDDRVIIFDGPPLLATPQTQILVSLVGQIVFVIEAGKTSQAIVEEALELIPEEKATGIVMNKNEKQSMHGGYYYGYYGNYGAEDGNKK